MGKWLKSIAIAIIFCTFVPLLELQVQANNKDFKIAFIRDHQLWIKNNNTEKKVTSAGTVTYPIWSFDGSLLAYKKNNELWIYDVLKDSDIKIYQGDFTKFEWSPTENLLAFQQDKVLNIVNTHSLNKSKFQNVILGVGNFSWLPNGKGFLVSSEANPLPTGWSNVELYIVPKDTNMDKKKISHFYTLPPQSDTFFAIGTSGFKWSKNGKWLSFITYPTASLSADANYLCVLSSDGQAFYNIGNMLLNENWMKWAHSTDKLAFINGIGRFAIKNKQLTIEKIPSLEKNVVTPAGYVDWDFTWHDDQIITVSRAKESEWDNEQEKRPLPSLYQINFSNNQQQKIMNPPKGYGDYHPLFLVDFRQLNWIRTNRKTAELWKANQNGTEAEKYISKIDVPASYYDMYDWDEVISFFIHS